MEKRIFPCLDINKSGTRKEELLLADKDAQPRLDPARSSCTRSTSSTRWSSCSTRSRKTDTNDEFIDSMSS